MESKESSLFLFFDLEKMINSYIIIVCEDRIQRFFAAKDQILFSKIDSTNPNITEGIDND